MEKVKCILSYDGSRFSGFQIQPGKRTIQGEIEKALKKIHKGTSIRIQASGRTDTGVHAIGQTIHFESHFALPEANWQQALNTLLPGDIHVHHVEKVPDTFHARYDAVEKEYRYYVWHAKEWDVFKRNYMYQFSYPLNLERMQKACTYFLGEHDFTTFSSAKATIKGSKTRALREVTCTKSGNKITFTFRGSGFLYHMVRIMVGCLLDIGQGRRKPEDIPELIAKRDRRLLGATVPADGLYLWQVDY